MFAPKLPTDQLAAFVRAVAPVPVNAIITGPDPQLSLARFAELGVRRISTGSALARVAWGAFLAAARGIAETGAFDALAPAVPFAMLDGFFAPRL